ncbi:glycosyl hydrolase [Paenibacillus campi]|uniref:glycosyl hydrolase n=1 Tax=Paenibacillus campi TaxID=3106031 RepID=UPI002AFF8515|nr:MULTISPECIES: glycosyl hydrolase [unclassified Paenibacillus]
MRVTQNRRVLIALVIGIAVIVIGLTALFTIRALNQQPSPTASFIEQSMVNANGTIASYLKPAPSTDPNVVAGREALSESLGLWMQYTLLENSQPDFDRSYQLLNQYFMSPQHYIWWKLQPDGQSIVHTYALGDDLRIVSALLEAYGRWNVPGYLTTSKQITDTLWQYGLNNGYLVDYHDFEHNTSSNLLSLTYIDTLAFERMKQYGLISDELYERHMQLLRTIPNDGLFYPRTFDVINGKYGYDTEVNLIDQLIIGLHLAEMNRPPDKLVAFLKQQFAEDGHLYGRYYASNHQPAVRYESPSVYGLAILLAVQMNDRAWAQQLYERMIMFRASTGSDIGGYVSDGDTHAFDNLLALLAETTLQQIR